MNTLEQGEVPVLDARDSRPEDCWSRIGISGDRSCPELATHIHCRNCPVFADAARGFFARSAPEGYSEEWTRLLATPVTAQGSDTLSVLLFRLGPEWLAFRTRVVVEVTSTRPVHRIPHRSGSILTGMVNLRGQLQLLVSLHGLLQVEGVGAAGGEEAPRLVVIRPEGATWVFTADEVIGVEHFPRAAIQSVPSNLANPLHSFSQAVIRWRDRSVGFLDESRVQSALRGVGQ